MAQSRAFAAGLASGVLVGRAIGFEQAMFGRSAGWSIAGPDAAGRVTDCLNAAYYRVEASSAATSASREPCPRTGSRSSAWT